MVASGIEWLQFPSFETEGVARVRGLIAYPREGGDSTIAMVPGIKLGHLDRILEALSRVATVMVYDYSK